MGILQHTQRTPERIVKELLTDARARRVVTHFLKTGKPLKVAGMVCNAEYHPEGITPVGDWSQHAEPTLGWVPTNETLRQIILRMAA